ncbi:MAG: hypothetical protein WD733_11640 [Bryobacterales bacterium]
MEPTIAPQVILEPVEIDQQLYYPTGSSFVGYGSRALTRLDEETEAHVSRIDAKGSQSDAGGAQGGGGDRHRIAHQSQARREKQKKRWFKNRQR